MLISLKNLLNIRLFLNQLYVFNSLVFLIKHKAFDYKINLGDAQKLSTSYYLSLEQRLLVSNLVQKMEYDNNNSHHGYDDSARSSQATNPNDFIYRFNQLKTDGEIFHSGKFQLAQSFLEQNKSGTTTSIFKDKNFISQTDAVNLFNQLMSFAASVPLTDKSAKINLYNKISKVIGHVISAHTPVSYKSETGTGYANAKTTTDKIALYAKYPDLKNIADIKQASRDEAIKLIREEIIPHR